MSADTGPAIELRGVTSVFRTPAGRLHRAASGLGPTVRRGEFMAVVGPTGRAESTTLTRVRGRGDPTASEVLVYGPRVDGVSAPEALFMGEPLSALDLRTKALMPDKLLELWAGVPASVAVRITRERSAAHAAA